MRPGDDQRVHPDRDWCRFTPDYYALIKNAGQPPNHEGKVTRTRMHARTTHNSPPNHEGKVTRTRMHARARTTHKIGA